MGVVIIHWWCVEGVVIVLCEGCGHCSLAMCGGVWSLFIGGVWRGWGHCSLVVCGGCVVIVHWWCVEGVWSLFIEGVWSLLIGWWMNACNVQYMYGCALLQDPKPAAPSILPEEDVKLS